MFPRWYQPCPRAREVPRRKEANKGRRFSRLRKTSRCVRPFPCLRLKGKRGRGAYGKTTVFGIFERDGRVYTDIVPDCSKPTLQGIIRGRVDPETVIDTPARQICDANRLPGNGRLVRL